MAAYAAIFPLELMIHYLEHVVFWRRPLSQHKHTPDKFIIPADALKCIKLHKCTQKCDGKRLHFQNSSVAQRAFAKITCILGVFKFWANMVPPTARRTRCVTSLPKSGPQKMRLVGLERDGDSVRYIVLYK